MEEMQKKKKNPFEGLLDGIEAIVQESGIGKFVEETTGVVVEPNIYKNGFRGRIGDHKIDIKVDLSTRFLDYVPQKATADEDSSPIRGVFSDRNPLVSIEKACKYFPFDFDFNLQGAKDFVSESKTQEEIEKVNTAGGTELDGDGVAAIWVLTFGSDLHRPLNAALRNEDHTLLQKHYLPYLRVLIRALRAIKKAEGYDVITVNRGIKSDVLTKYSNFYVEGESVVEWANTSCTTTVPALEFFLGKTGPRTILQITTKHSVDICRFSAISAEHEVLLPPGSILKITSIGELGGGLRMIHCQC